MKRLRIEHQTGFSYQGDVTASYNEARMLPVSTDSQFVLSSTLDIEPSTSVNQYVDYFGTRVAAFDVLSPHGDLSITARSLVEVRPRPIEHADISWDQLAGEVSRSIETVEQLTQTRRTTPHPEVADIARSIAAQHDRPGPAALAIATAIGDAVEYMHGVTGVHSTASEAWEARKGVCQDIARSESRRATCRGTCIRSRTPRSAWRSPVSRTPGWSGSSESGRASTRPTPPRSAIGTCSSVAGATTTMCRRCAAYTPARTRAICT